MGLAARCRPAGPFQVYFAITMILSRSSAGPTLARVVRGQFLALREEDFVMAAAALRRQRSRIIFRHMVPSLYSHIIAATHPRHPRDDHRRDVSLSFLGLGLRPPAVSWGVLLHQAQNIQTVATTPWLLSPAVPSIVAGPRLQLPRRRPARRRRPLFAIAAPPMSTSAAALRARSEDLTSCSTKAR